MFLLGGGWSLDSNLKAYVPTGTEHHLSMIRVSIPQKVDLSGDNIADHYSLSKDSNPTSVG